MNHSPVHGCESFRALSSPAFLTRRQMLQRAAAGFGAIAFAALAHEDAQAQAARQSPLDPRPTHFPAKAKRVIYLQLEGGMASQDTFDYKSELNRRDGQDPPAWAGPSNKTPKLLGSPFKWNRHGNSGLWISDCFQHTARHADDLCVISSLYHGTNDHNQAILHMHTGDARNPRPCFGSWITYGLGSEARDLPGFVVINPVNAPANSRSGFLPDVFTATPLRDIGRAGASPVPDLAINRRTLDQQRRQLTLIQERNRRYAERSPDDSRLDAVIESYERGFLMQQAYPDVLNIYQEPRETLAMYGLDQSGAGPRLAQQILLARRMIERGVRFVEIGDHAWDTHLNLRVELPRVTGGLDQPLAALLTDLKRRGMFEDTLVVIGGEFGRTSAGEIGMNQPPGRDHNCRGFTWVLAGGGVKGGFKYGGTDELGFAAVENRCQVHDLYATMLHLLGMDHRRMTYRYAGRDFTLPDVHGDVIREIVA